MTCKHWFEGMVERSETMCPFCEIDNLRADLATQVVLVEKCMVAMNENADRGEKAEVELARLKTQEPVMWQYRTKPTWDRCAPWLPWTDCSKDSFKNYLRIIGLEGDWLYEVRALYAAPVQPAPLSDRHTAELKALAMLLRNMVSVTISAKKIAIADAIDAAIKGGAT